MYRKLIGLIFVKIIKILFSINLSDTQCGFKLYKKILLKLFSNLKMLDFTHDIEIVLISKKKGYRIKELPVNWIHKKVVKFLFLKIVLKCLFLY